MSFPKPLIVPYKAPVAFCKRMMHWTARLNRSPLAPAIFIEPCLPTRVPKPPRGPEWVHEVKHDGFRLQIHRLGAVVRLFTRTGIDWTHRYPWIVEGVKRLKAQHFVIDAEACCEDGSGITDFAALHSRTKDGQVFAYGFDLLAENGTDIRRQPLADRKKALARLLRRARPGIRFSEHLSGDGEVIHERASQARARRHRQQAHRRALPIGTRAYVA